MRDFTFGEELRRPSGGEIDSEYTDDPISPTVDAGTFAILKERAAAQGIILEHDPITQEVRQITPKATETEPPSDTRREYTIDTRDGPIVISRTTRDEFRIDGVTDPINRGWLGVAMAAFATDIWRNSENGAVVPHGSAPVATPAPEFRVVKRDDDNLRGADTTRIESQASRPSPDHAPTAKQLPYTDITRELEKDQQQPIGSKVVSAEPGRNRRQDRADRRAERNRGKARKLKLRHKLGITVVSVVVGFGGGFHQKTGEWPELSDAKLIVPAVLDAII